jgi:hypothetical protein
VRQHAAQRWTKNEAETEGGTDQSVRAGAIFRLGDVGDVGARCRDIAAGQTVDDARGEEHRDVVRERQHHEADDGSGETEYEHGPAPVPIGQVAEDRGGRQLTQREHGEEEPDDNRRRAERFCIKRQKRNDDSEADEIDKNC